MNKKEIDLEMRSTLKELVEKVDKILAIVTIEPPASQHKKIKKKKKDERLQAGY